MSETVYISEFSGLASSCCGVIIISEDDARGEGVDYCPECSQCITTLDQCLL